MVKIISTSQTAEQTQKDLPAIQKAHDEAMKAEPTWRFFGGVITIENRQYQVVEG